MPLSRPQRQRLLALARGRSDEPLRVLEGRKAVLEALEAGLVAELYVSGGLDAPTRAGLAAAAARAGLAPVPLDPGDLDRLAGTVSPQGVLALVRDTVAPLPALLERRGTLLWLAGVQDPGNVGAVVRVAAAFGAAGLLAGTGTADPLGVKALRASAGLALRVPFARALDEAVAQAVAGRPVWLLEKGGRDVFGVGAPPPGLVLVLGSEGSGAPEAARRAATDRVGVPLAEPVESLNAAVAMGIVLAVLARRAGPGA